MFYMLEINMGLNPPLDLEENKQASKQVIQVI